MQKELSNTSNKSKLISFKHDLMAQFKPSEGKFLVQKIPQKYTGLLKNA